MTQNYGLSRQDDELAHTRTMALAEALDDAHKKGMPPVEGKTCLAPTAQQRVATSMPSGLLHARPERMEWLDSNGWADMQRRCRNARTS